MSDDHAIEPKATIAVVQRLVNELSDKVDAKLGKMDDSMREGFTDLRAAIESLREEIPTRRECQYRHEESDTAINSAVHASEGDRQKLWDAIHTVESQLRWGAGIVILAFLGILVSNL
jgi:hypothetical protein